MIGPPVAAVVVLRPRCEFRVSRHERPDSRLDNRANSRCVTMGVFRVVGQAKSLISHETSSPERMTRLARYEVHLDRKLERTLAMLIRLRDLRDGVAEE